MTNSSSHHSDNQPITNDRQSVRDPSDHGSLVNDHQGEDPPGNDVSASHLAGGGPNGVVHPSSCCSICTQILGRNRPGNDEIEFAAFLPCGHYFGHKCLFPMLEGQNGEGPQITRCPVFGCVTLRHACGHLAIPTDTRPEELFREPLAVVNPNQCQSCVASKKNGKQPDIAYLKGQYDAAKDRRETAQDKYGLAALLHWSSAVRYIWRKRRFESAKNRVGENHKKYMQDAYEDFRAMEIDPQMRPEHHRQVDTAASESNPQPDEIARYPHEPPQPVSTRPSKLQSLRARINKLKFRSEATQAGDSQTEQPIAANGNEPVRGQA